MSSHTITLPDYAYERLERYTALLGGEWEAFLDALRRPLPVGAWRNSARIGCDAFEAWFAEVEPGVELEPLSWFQLGYRLWTSHDETDAQPRTSGPEDAAPLEFHPSRGQPHRSSSTHGTVERRPDPRPGNRLSRALGLLHLQEEVSMIPPVLLEPQPGERVLDLCGAPGNKTALIASLMEDRGTVLCNDTDLKRLRAGRAAWERLGLSSIAASNLDGGSFPGRTGAWDRVLVDAPCSGEGTSRRVVSALRPGPLGYYRMLHGRQRKLLERALELCRPGGRVVYSTCTYAPEENELVIADVLERTGQTGNVAILPTRLAGLTASSGITEWDGRKLVLDLENALRIWPHQNDTGGFFVAVLEKRSPIWSSADTIPVGHRDSGDTQQRPTEGSHHG